MITDDELQRYRRQLLIDGWDISTQSRLKNSTIFVAGAGGLGSPVIYYLAAAGIGHIVICDNDSVELSNLNRQILYETSDIGYSKADNASMRISRLNNRIKITACNSDAGYELYDKIKECDLIIDCLDNFKTRHILNRISVQTGIPMIHAGVSDFYGQITFLMPGETPCLACFIPEDITDRSKGIIGAMAGIIGSIQAIEAIKYLTESGDLLKNRFLYIDAKSMKTAVIKLKKNPDCKICGKKR